MNGLQALKKETEKRQNLSSPHKIQKPAALRALALLASPAPSFLLQGPGLLLSPELASLTTHGLLCPPAWEAHATHSSPCPCGWEQQAGWEKPASSRQEPVSSRRQEIASAAGRQ